METTFKYEEPKKLIYHDYSNFSTKCFKDDFMSRFCQEKHDYSDFEKKFIDTLNKHAPKKIKTFRGNQKPHINKTLRKAIMKRLQLKNKVNKTRNAADVSNNKSQRNYVEKRNNQCKKDHFDRLNPEKDSKRFWKSCKTYFSNKHSFGESKIALSEYGEFLTENNKIAKTFNSFFETVTDSLNLFSWSSKVKVCDDKVQGIILNFSNHPSILKIKETFQLNKRFSFQHVSEVTVRKVAKNLPSDKISAGEITFCFPELTNCINESLTNNKFLDTLKLSDITPVFKKLDPSDKANYRPVSILPFVSKVFEKIMFDQLYEYIERFLNQLLCGFRKAHSTQHALFRLLRKWQKELDSGGYIGTSLMDLSKAYDCLPHDLLIAKLEAYGLDNNSLNLLLDYLSFRKQRTKVGSAYSKWSKIRRGILQGSILGLLLFNIFINDIFMIIEQSDICNFADDNTLYSCGERLTEIKENLVSDTKRILNWFRLSSLKANPGKFQFMILGDKSHHKHILKINSIKIEASDDILLLGITIDKKLTFKQHIENLCRKAHYKLHALRRIRKFLTTEKAKILGNVFIDSQFNYAPLLWMFCRKTLYSKIEKIHHKTLKVIYEPNDTYDKLLLQSNTVSVHQRHLRFLVTEIYKSISQLNSEFMWSYFTHKDMPYNLRKGPFLGLPKAHSFYYGTNAVHFRGSLIWNNPPAVIKSSDSLFEFKNEIKNIGDIDCGRLICRNI